MATYPFMQVDAFTSTPLTGNPCAIVFDADDLSDETMQAIARENNLSETAFVLSPTKPAEADVRVRFFTPSDEIPLAGHPTIATIFALVETGRLPLMGEGLTVRLELRDGPILVEVETEDGNVQQVTMSQRKPQFLATYDAAEVLPIFGLPVEAALGDVPIQTVNTGTPQLMVPLVHQNALRHVSVNLTAFTEFHQRADFFSVHLFCLGGETDAGDTFARHFAPPPDIFEDPFTGSATGNMGTYLWRYGLIEQPTFVAEQGHWLQQPGAAQVEVIGPRDDIETVKVGGPAVTVIVGEMRL